MDDSIQIIEDDDDDDVIVIDDPSPNKPAVPVVILCDSDDDDNNDNDTNFNGKDKSDLNCSRANNIMINQTTKQMNDWYEQYKSQGTRSPYYTCPECLASLSTVYFIDRHFQARHPKSVHRFQKNKQNPDTLHILSDSEETSQLNEPETLSRNTLLPDQRLSPLKEKSSSGARCLKLNPLPPTSKRPSNSTTNTNSILPIPVNLVSPLPPLASLKPADSASCTTSTALTSTMITRSSVPMWNNNPNTPLRVMISDRTKERVVKVNSNRNSNATQEGISTINSGDQNVSNNTNLSGIGEVQVHSMKKVDNDIWTRLARIKDAIFNKTGSSDGTTQVPSSDDQCKIRVNRRAKRKKLFSKNNLQATNSKVNDVTGDDEAQNKGISPMSCANSSNQGTVLNTAIQDNTVESSSQDAICEKRKRKRRKIERNIFFNALKRTKVDGSKITTKKPITCGLCHRRFSDFQARRIHNKIFHKKKPFHSKVSPVPPITHNPPDVGRLSQMKHIVLIDVDNWRKVLESDLKFSPSTFVWAFHGGSTIWQPSQSSIILKHLQDEDCFYLHPKSGTSKDAADFALCVQAGKLDVQLPKEIPFTVLSGDGGFRELQNQLSLSKRAVHLVNPHHKTTNTVLNILNSIADS